MDAQPVLHQLQILVKIVIQATFWLPHIVVLKQLNIFKEQFVNQVAIQPIMLKDMFVNVFLLH